MLNLKKKKQDRPTIIIVAGFAGSGKSTIGKLISKNMRFAYLDKDTLTRYFTDEMLESKGVGKGDRESTYYTELINPLEYNTLVKVALENVELGISVVLSAPFIRQLNSSSWFADKVDEFSSLSDCKVKVVWIESSREIERIRLIDRNADRDLNKLDNWDEYCDSIADFNLETDYEKYIFYNTENNIDNIENQINSLIKWIVK
jgi:predicted kinase